MGDRTDPLEAARAALAGTEAWLVGGAVRDRLSGRALVDLDITVDRDPEAAARAVGRALRAPAFPLNQAFGAWRIDARDGAWHIDVSPLHGGSLDEDLAQRDFTVNAMAEPLDGGGVIDPFGGRDDLAQGRLRMVSASAFDRDPLRVLRLPRITVELGFRADPDTLVAARAHAPGLSSVAGERIFGELKRIVAAPDVRLGLELMEELGATPVVLPELWAQRGVAQNRFHHLDVHDHTLAVLDEVLALERDPARALGEHADEVSALLAEEFSDDIPRSVALRLGAIFHDAAKPQTRWVSPDGRIGFPGHDAAGAEVASAALARLKASRRLRTYVADLARHHLRLGFLVHERPLTRQAIYRYLIECAPVEIDVTLLSVADRLATRGDNAEAAIAKHLDLARELLGEALRRRAAGRLTPLLRGDELADALGLAPGPEIGRLLAGIEEARFVGDVSSRDEAIAWAREQHRAG